MRPLRASWSTLSAALLLPLVFACSEPLDPLGQPPEDVPIDFEPREGLDPSAWLRPVNLAFHSSATDLTTAPDGSTWLVRHEWRDGTFFGPGYWMLSRYSAEGLLLAEFPVPEGIRRIVAHPSGELTVVGWELSPDAVERRRSVQLRRLRADGSLVAERVLRSEIPPAERLAYVANEEGHVARVTLLEAERFLTVLDIEAHGEDVYLATGMDGLRILRLDGTLNTRWLTPVAPSLSLRVTTHEAAQRLGAPFRNTRLTVDEEGRPYIASEFPVVARMAYWDAFAREPEGPQGRGFLLVGLESTGALRSARVIATEHAEFITDLAVRGETFGIGARVRSPLAEEGKTFDANLFFAAGRLDRPPSEDVSRTLALDKDDEPEAFVACGTDLFCFAGHTGHVTLDTRRTVSAGKGFLLAVDARGEQKSLTRLTGPRDTTVQAAAAAPGGAVVFAFTTNAPHSMAEAPAHLKSNELWLGRLNTP